jgi:hypothetical protein
VLGNEKNIKHIRFTFNKIKPSKMTIYIDGAVMMKPENLIAFDGARKLVGL